MFSDEYLTALVGLLMQCASSQLYWLVVGAMLCLLFPVLYFCRWRRDGLAAQYAHWQREAQRVEVATHTALYGSLGEKNHANYPYVTIVLPSLNSAGWLAYDLPRLLTQHYEGKFEVIVADMGSEDNTLDVIKRYQSDYQNLRVTRVPVSSRQIELRKLAVTLGVKAAYGEWVMVIEEGCSPISKDWLQCYAENLAANLNFVEAYYNYEDDGTWRARRAILERVRMWNVKLQAYDRGRILNCGSANYAIRREWFLSEGGFADSLVYPYGEETLFAVRHAVPDSTMLLTSPDTKLVEDLPDRQELMRRRMVERLTYRHLPYGIRCYAWRESVVSCCWYVFLILWWMYVLSRVGIIWGMREYLLADLVPDTASLIIGICALIFSVSSLRRSLRALDERRYGAYVWLFDTLQPWHRMALRMRALFSSGVISHRRR